MFPPEDETNALFETLLQKYSVQCRKQCSHPTGLLVFCVLRYKQRRGCQKSTIVTSRGHKTCEYITIFWDDKLCNLVGVYRRFRGS